MKTIINNHEFITFKIDNAEFVFSTAKNNLNFNKNSQEGKKNLNLIGEYFNVHNVGYLDQIHSDIVVDYKEASKEKEDVLRKGEKELLNDYDEDIKKADAIITNETNTAIGVFTADCVPVLIYDRKKKVASAVHSGWQGTAKGICPKTLDTLKNKYGCNFEDLIVYIGPHNKGCCYEFGEDMVNKYFNEYLKKDKSIYVNNKLDIEKCIIQQLTEKGVPRENIKTLNLCTYCSCDFEFYSYRKQTQGRMFSFVIIR